MGKLMRPPKVALPEDLSISKYFLFLSSHKFHKIVKTAAYGRTIPHPRVITDDGTVIISLTILLMFFFSLLHSSFFPTLKFLWGSFQISLSYMCMFSLFLHYTHHIIIFEFCASFSFHGFCSKIISNLGPI